MPQKATSRRMSSGRSARRAKRSGASVPAGVPGGRGGRRACLRRGVRAWCALGHDGDAPPTAPGTPAGDSCLHNSSAQPHPLPAPTRLVARGKAQAVALAFSLGVAAPPVQARGQLVKRQLVCRRGKAGRQARRGRLSRRRGLSKARDDRSNKCRRWLHATGSRRQPANPLPAGPTPALRSARRRPRRLPPTWQRLLAVGAVLLHSGLQRLARHLGAALQAAARLRRFGRETGESPGGEAAGSLALARRRCRRSGGGGGSWRRRASLPSCAPPPAAHLHPGGKLAGVRLGLLLVGRGGALDRGGSAAVGGSGGRHGAMRGRRAAERGRGLALEVQIEEGASHACWRVQTGERCAAPHAAAAPAAVPHLHPGCRPASDLQICHAQRIDRRFKVAARHGSRLGAMSTHPAGPAEPSAASTSTAAAAAAAAAGPFPSSS